MQQPIVSPVSDPSLEKFARALRLGGVWPWDIISEALAHTGLGNKQLQVQHAC